MADLLFKERCIVLRKQGLSLNQIIRATRRAKTSIHFHIKDIPLTYKRRREIGAASTKRLFAYSQRIKGSSRLNRHPQHFTNWTAGLVSLVGHLLFDGEIKHEGCVYTNRSAALLMHVQSEMRAIYNFPPNQYESLPGVHKIGYYNVELSSYLRKKSHMLLKNIFAMKIDLRRAFVRAFFDDEGSVYFIGKRRAIRGYQHNPKILYLIQKLLTNFGIESAVSEKFNEVTISRRKNLERFAKEINFTPGLRVNGNRSNSIWKKNLEKRSILKKALDSYQN